MAKIDLQYDLQNYTPASASPPQANFNRIEQHINQEVIERGGTVAMAAQLKLVGDPVAPLDAAPKQYVDQVLPIGIIMMFGGANVPPGGRWAVCNGAELEASSYPALFAVIANNFSPAGTPAGRFHLPNLQSRFAYGGTPGATGGSADAIVPVHSHSIDHGHPDSSSGNDNAEHTHVGANHAHGVSIRSGDDTVQHYHYMRGKEVVPNPGGSFGQSVVIDRTATNFGFIGQTDGISNSHQHDVNGGTGLADRGLTTSGRSAVHQHATSTPAMTGRSGTEGVAVTNTNLPPYLGVAHIMRIS